MDHNSDPVAEADALVAKGEPQAAVDLLQALFAQGRGGMLARFALVRALLGCGAHDEALDAARDAASLAFDIPDAVLTLADALFACGLMAPAIAEYQRALRLDPHSGIAWVKLARAWLDAGETAKTREMLGGVEETDETFELMAQADVLDAAPRSAAGYVRHLFDQFSTDYDARMLNTLGYQAHVILRDMADLVMAGASDLRILDLGCGTGLAGAVFRERAKTLDGIDLSPRMIEASRARGIYDRLWVGDIETGLTQERGHYDLLLAADTLIYLGDLAPVFSNAAWCLDTDGFFIFSVESVAGEGYTAGPKRRWMHSEIYLRRAADEAGFDIAGFIQCSPRMESHIPVPGLAVALQLRRPAASLP